MERNRKLKVIPKSSEDESNPSRCAYCHGNLGNESSSKCAGCGTLMHSDCHGEVCKKKPCTTLGCTGKAPPKPEPSLYASKTSELYRRAGPIRGSFSSDWRDGRHLPGVTAGDNARKYTANRKQARSQEIEAERQGAAIKRGSQDRIQTPTSLEAPEIKSNVANLKGTREKLKWERLPLHKKVISKIKDFFKRK